jgi:hypothetical protein
MDVQAYFEEWSRMPGETVRTAISTKHKSVRATLERITRGPSNEGSGSASSSFGVPIPSVDVTVPGVEQPTAVGSHAELPLGGAFGPAFALHFWFYSSVPSWEDLQALVAGASGEGETFALAIRKSELVGSVRGQSRALGLSVQPFVWYSAVLSVDTHHDKSEVLVHIKQVKGLPGPAAVRHARIAFDGAVPRFDKLLLATRAISPIGSTVDGFNGKIDSPAFFDRTLGEGGIRRIARRRPRERVSRLELRREFPLSRDSRSCRARAERRHPQWRGARRDRPQLDGARGLIRRRTG